jgi:MULE transposase-like protein
MPLLDIVGVASSGKSFYVGFCFVSKENAEHFTFALRCLQEVYSQLNLDYLGTILTDGDEAGARTRTRTGWSSGLRAALEVKEQSRSIRAVAMRLARVLYRPALII